MKDINAVYKYRVQIFNNSSWGGWITVSEVNTWNEAVECMKAYAIKGYEVIAHSIS